MNKRQKFDELIKPLVEAIALHCKELDIPGMFDFLIERDETLGRSKHLSCTILGKDTPPDRTLLEAKLVLDEGTIEAAMLRLILMSVESGEIQEEQIEVPGLGTVMRAKIELGRGKIKAKKDELDRIDPINKGNPY